MTDAPARPAAAKDPAARATVVTVTYRSGDTIAGFLAALPPGLPLVVVDNASGDDTPDRIAAAAPQARLVRHATNRGFGAGCNAGIDAATSEFILLLNPDARLRPGAIDTLLAAADAWPDAAILAPAIINQDGTRVRSYDASQRRRRLLPRKRHAEPWPEGPACVDFASGAAMLLRRTDGLRFDESIFLFYEDDVICDAAHALGRAVVYVPDAVVVHAGGRSSLPTLRIRARKAFHMALSRQVLLARHGGQDPAARLVHHAGRAIGHAITLRGAKLVEDLAGLAGTLAALRARRR
jgi:GT2 family glycosyltransferase